MRHAKMGRVGPRSGGALAALVSALALTMGACGGEGNGFAVQSDPLRITSTTIAEQPNGADANTLFESTDQVNFEIPLSGGCGGPYVVTVISGVLPDGIAIDDSVDPGPTLSPSDDVRNHHLRGTLLQDGIFLFRIQVVDKGCEPFATTHADFRWEVARGKVAIVGSNPAMHPPGTLIKNGVVQNPVYPALPTVVYNQFTSIQILVAGGFPPYSMQVIDDPTNPDDGSLPLGMSIPANSTSIIGSAAEVRPGGAPFVFTLQVTDSQGQTGQLTVQWQVATPPIIISNTELPDGKAGTVYGDTIVIVDGVPPFRFEFVKCDVNRDGAGEPAVTYQSPQPPVIAPACASQRLSAADYPAQNLLGPDYRSLFVPPEGIYLGDQENLALVGNGTIGGVPRRRGDFRVVIHVYSAIVPNEQGQHSWKQYEFTIAPSEPPTSPTPAFAQNPAYTLEGLFRATQPYSRIPEAEIGANYNPDAGSHPALGLQLLGRGGVRKDGKTDAPHGSEVAIIEGLSPAQEDASTPGGGYDWTLNPNPTSPPDGDAYSAIPGGMTFDSWIGVWRVGNAAGLQRQGLQALEFTMRDQQLPTQVQNVEAQRVNFAIGPDKVIITESTTSNATVSGSAYTMNDHEQTVRVVEPYSAIAPVLRDLNSTDLSPTHGVPSTTGGAAIDELLAGQDILRVFVNASGWWDDLHGLNAGGARPFQHGDPNKQYNWMGSGYSGDANWQPSVTAVEIQRCTTSTVTHDPLGGVYKDGGKLYAFGNATYFGIFMVRADSTIYVPCAFDRNTYQAFGDSWISAHGEGVHSLVRSPHLAVSPDGRFGALKLKASETDFAETAASTRILIFSLTGEKAFAGATYKIVTTGAVGNTLTGVYHYAPSMVLTNRHLYYIVGNHFGAPESSWHGHYVYRYEIANAAGAVTAVAPGGTMLTAAVPDAAWTNTLNNPLQTPFQNWTTPTQQIGVWLPPPTSTFTFTTGTSDEMYLNDGASFGENSAAPLPFRVSRDGKAVAILAAIDPNTTSSTNVMNHHVWVDYDGSGVRRLSTAQRHAPNGAQRGYQLAYGPSSYPLWHRFNGPSTHLEISDDASKVAVVVNRMASTVSSFSYTNWTSTREDVIAYRTANNWVSGTVELPVTGDNGANRIFGGSAFWRFGALTFTKDGKGLVFYGGLSSFHATSSSYQEAYQYTGSLWGADISTATAITGLTVTNLLPTADGGASVGIANYTTSSPYSPTIPNGSFASGVVSGSIKPYGGFLSGNREFLYLMTFGAVTAAKPENLRLVGVNIRSTNTAQNIGGRTDFRAFNVGSWPTRRGFVPNYYYFASYPLQNRFYAPGHSQGASQQVMARDSGYVFFGSHYQRSGGGGATAGTASSFGGPVIPTYWGDYGAYGGQVEGFSADVGGPVRRLTSLGSDTAYRQIQFIETTHTGSEIAFMFDQNSNTKLPDQERLQVVRNIAFDAAGLAVGAAAAVPIEAGGGRAGDSMAFGFMRDRLYYAYQTGPGGNENNKQVIEAVINLATNAVSRRVLVATAARYNVLHAGR